jgi:hypothetical protein
MMGNVYQSGALVPQQQGLLRVAKERQERIFPAARKVSITANV